MKYTIRLILAIIISATLTACASMQPAGQAYPPLRVEFTFWWGDYALLVAKEKGFFEKYGVEVEPIYYPTYTNAFSDLAAGQIDAALIAIGDGMNISRHIPVKVIALSDDGSYMTMVARPEIQSISDLRGKNVGTIIGSPYELMAYEMLRSAGMTVSDVKLLNINTEDAPRALANNTIQAGFIWEPYTTQAVNEGNHIIFPLDTTIRYFPDGLTFRADVVEKRPEEIRAFLRAWFEAVTYRIANPEETREIAAKYLGVSLGEVQPDNNLKVLTYAENVALYNPAIENKGSIYNVAHTTADYLISSGALATRPDLNAMLDPQYFILP